MSSLLTQMVALMFHINKTECSLNGVLQRTKSEKVSFF